MKIDFPFRRLVLSVVLISVFPSLPAQDLERPIWEQEVMLIYSDSSTEFNRLRSLGRDNKRLSLYTTALDTLHGKIQVEAGEEPFRVSQRLFRIIVADKEDDAIGLAAAYYLARIAQSNPIEQDMAQAKKLYWDLYQKWPERFFGQMAFVKYATLEIYDDDGSGEQALSRIQRLELMIDAVTLPEMRQNLHRIIGEAYITFDLESKPAFEHLLAAYELGIPVESIRVEVLQKIALLAEELGDLDRALKAYEDLTLVARYHEKFISFVENASRLRKQLGQAAVEAAK